MQKLTDDQVNIVSELQKVHQSFTYFLLNYVFTLDSQAMRGTQPIPDWPFVRKIANQIDSARQTVILKSRQMLVSWILAAYALHQSIYFTGANVLVVSKGGRESREIGDRASFIYRHLPEWLKVPNKSNAQYGEVAFPSMDSRYICLPSTDDIGRTFSGNLIILDEMAYLPFGSLIMGALAPIIDVKGRFVGVSTPNGKDSLFYPVWHDDNADIQKLRLHYSERPDRDENWVKRMRLSVGITEQKWLREYEMSFATPAGKPVYGLFSAKQIQPWKEHWHKGHILIIGPDRGFHYPAMLWTFVNKDDQLVIAKEFLGRDMERGAFIRKCAEMTAATFGDAENITWVPADFLQADSDGRNWKKIMEDAGFNVRVGKAGKDEVIRRVDATRRKLALRQDGKYGMIIDPSCEILIEGLAGGYHYPEVIDKPENEKPEKDGYYDHLANCLEVICDNHFTAFSGKRELKTIFLNEPVYQSPRRGYVT
jgi:hypothetical protein